MGSHQFKCNVSLRKKLLFLGMIMRCKIFFRGLGNRVVIICLIDRCTPKQIILFASVYFTVVLLVKLSLSYIFKRILEDDC